MHTEFQEFKDDKAGFLENMIILCLAVPAADREKTRIIVAEYAAGAFPETQYAIKNAISRINRRTYR
jgi:hypothetical protein